MTFNYFSRGAFAALSLSLILATGCAASNGAPDAPDTGDAAETAVSDAGLPDQEPDAEPADEQDGDSDELQSASSESESLEDEAERVPVADDSVLEAADADGTVTMEDVNYIISDEEYALLYAAHADDFYWDDDSWASSMDSQNQQSQSRQEESARPKRKANRSESSGSSSKKDDEDYNDEYIDYADIAMTPVYQPVGQPAGQPGTYQVPVGSYMYGYPQQYQYQYQQYQPAYTAPSGGYYQIPGGYMTGYNVG